MQNLFYGALALLLFSVNTVEKSERLELACPEGYILVNFSCGTSICAQFPDTFSPIDRANWALAEDARRCPTKPKVPELQPAI